jgi:hypothetical protein
MSSTMVADGSGLRRGQQADDWANQLDGGANGWQRMTAVGILQDSGWWAWLAVEWPKRDS